MRWLCMIGLFVGCVLIFVWREYRKDVIIRLYGNRRSYIFECGCLKIGGYFVKDTSAKRSQIRNLNPRGDINEILIRQQIIAGRFVMGTWMMLHSLGIIFSFIFQEHTNILESASIVRNRDDGTSETVMASVQGDTFLIEQFPVEVRDKLMEGQERTVLFEEAEKYVIDSIKDQNQSLEQVNQPLNLITKIPETSMDVIWNLDDAAYVFSDGSLDMAQIPDGGVWQTLKVTLAYGSDAKAFEIQVFLCHEKKEFAVLAKEEIEKSIEKANADGNNDNELQLPQEVLGEKIRWLETKSYFGEKMLGFIAVIIICLGFYWKESPKRHLLERSEQLASDYPKLIHKIVLLTGAGLNMRGTLEIIVDSQKNCSETKLHYVYEEVYVALKMMQQGVSEASAYESFGKQCGESMYIKLSMIMIQWVKKGASGMGDLMQGMAQEAMIFQKDQIKQCGEKMGTKLLMPMGLLLIVVFMILVIPAFLTMEI